MYASTVMLQVPNIAKRYKQFTVRNALALLYLAHMHLLLWSSALIGKVAFLLSAYVDAYDYGARSINSKDQ